MLGKEVKILAKIQENTRIKLPEKIVLDITDVSTVFNLSSYQANGSLGLLPLCDSGTQNKKHHSTRPTSRLLKKSTVFNWDLHKKAYVRSCVCTLVF